MLHAVNFQPEVTPNDLTPLSRQPHHTPNNQLAPGENLATIGILQVGRTFRTLR